MTEISKIAQKARQYGVGHPQRAAKVITAICRHQKPALRAQRFDRGPLSALRATGQYGQPRLADLGRLTPSIKL
jgi:hypothetical protein